MSINNNQFCLIEDQTQIEELKTDIIILKDEWDKDMGKIKEDLARLITFVNEVSKNYDNIKPKIDSFTNKIDKLTEKKQLEYYKYMPYISIGSTCILLLKLRHKLF